MQLLRTFLIAAGILFVLPACGGDRDKNINEGKDRPVPPSPAPAEKK